MIFFNKYDTYFLLNWFQMSVLAAPRKDHLGQLYYMFAYLKAKHNTTMVFDPTEPELKESE